MVMWSSYSQHYHLMICHCPKSGSLYPPPCTVALAGHSEKRILIKAVVWLQMILKQLTSSSVLNLNSVLI